MDSGELPTRIKLPKLPNHGDRPRGKVYIPPPQDQGQTIFLPTRDIKTDYTGAEFQLPDFRYETDINADPVAHEFVINLVNQIRRERFGLTQEWKQQGRQGELPSFEEVARKAVQERFPNYIVFHLTQAQKLLVLLCKRLFLT